MEKFKIIKTQVDKFDPFELLKDGCPPDEYDIESKMIAEAISEEMSEGEIATIMAKIFKDMFHGKYKADAFLPYAEQIKAGLDELKK